MIRPQTLIAAIIMKEQFTQFPPDYVVLEFTLLNDEEHFVGLGAIFPATTIKATDVEEYTKDDLIKLQKRLLTDDIYNIEMILVYFFKDLYSIDTVYDYLDKVRIEVINSEKETHNSYYNYFNKYRHI